MKIEIKKVKVWKIGPSSVVTIPKAFISNNLIVPNKFYSITLEEIE